MAATFSPVVPGAMVNATLRPAGTFAVTRYSVDHAA